jgi:hypothetical protein
MVLAAACGDWDEDRADEDRRDRDTRLGKMLPIGQMLLIGKMLPIGQMLLIGKMLPMEQMLLIGKMLLILPAPAVGAAPHDMFSPNYNKEL